MADLTDVSQLSGSSLTDDQIDGILNRLDLRIINLIDGDGKYALLPVEEVGLAGFKTDPTKLLDALLRARKAYGHLMSHPEERGDIAVILSEWDNPDL